MTITELAAKMNVSETDVSSFLACINHWMGKGMDYEAAINRHMEVMTMMVENSVPFSQSKTGKELVVDTFFPESA